MMVTDGEDWHGCKQRTWKIQAKIFKIHQLWRNFFKFKYSNMYNKEMVGAQSSNRWWSPYQYSAVFNFHTIPGGSLKYKS